MKKRKSVPVYYILVAALIGSIAYNANWAIQQAKLQRVGVVNSQQHNHDAPPKVRKSKEQLSAERDQAAMERRILELVGAKVETTWTDYEEEAATQTPTSSSGDDDETQNALTVVDEKLKAAQLYAAALDQGAMERRIRDLVGEPDHEREERERREKEEESSDESTSTSTGTTDPSSESSTVSPSEESQDESVEEEGEEESQKEGSNGEEKNSGEKDNNTHDKDTEENEKQHSTDNSSAAAATEADSTSEKPQPFVPMIEDKPIRKWGCDLTETPLIFVHNGKSGGGNIRARLAAAALDYQEGRKWEHHAMDNHYYPIQDDKLNTTRRGKFCNSQYAHYTHTPHIENPLTSKSFEGLMKCNATTPLGILYACPHVKNHRPGALKYLHYRDGHCAACNDDYYLDLDFYVPSEATKKTMEYRKKRNAAPREAKRGRDMRKDNETLPILHEGILDPASDRPAHALCDTVYTAHNNLGTELNFLPPRYLKQHWWDHSQYKSAKALDKYWDRFLYDRRTRRNELAQHLNVPIEDSNTKKEDRKRSWCPKGYKMDGDGDVEEQEGETIHYRPRTPSEYNKAYKSCSLPMAQKVDQAFVDAFFNGSHQKNNYSPFYASMPLHRITVMRDPWSWIISKFFWHSLDEEIPERTDGQPRCIDVEFLTKSKGGKGNPVDPLTGRALGWMEQYALLYMIKLCGSDCRMRYENGMMNLEDIEIQTADNLRNAFSVVGLLQEEESFYDMITDRIQYLDLRRNPQVRGQSHATKKTDENLACKDLYKDEAFRQHVRDTIPAFAALERLYHLGEKVNRFQQEELAQCKRDKGQEPTKGDYTAMYEKRQRRPRITPEEMQAIVEQQARRQKRKELREKQRLRKQRKAMKRQQEQ